MVKTESRKAEDIARAMLKGPLSDQAGGNGLAKMGDRWMIWRGYRWVPLREKDVFDEVLFSMQSVYTEDDRGNQVSISMSPKGAKDVMDILGALVRIPASQLPYKDPSLSVDKDWTVSVGDQLVTVGVEDILSTPRTSGWVSSCGTSFTYDPEAECPLWEKTVAEWADGDPEWSKLLGRCMGAALVPYRDWQRFIFMLGKVRGGKGVIMRLMMDLLGQSGVASRSLDDIADRNGLWGADVAGILFIDEVQDMDNATGERTAGNLKKIIGQSPVRIQDKYIAGQETTLPVMLWMAANQLPNLPDKGSGMSSKMLVLPFTKSFLGKEDLTLEDRLRDELPGILNWCLRHVQDLRRLKEEGNKKDLWPETKAGAKMRDQYRLMANPWDAFLDEYFLPSDKKGYISKARVRTMFKGWASKNHIKVPGHNYIISKMLSESSWDILEGQVMSTGERVLRGIRLKRIAGSSLD